MGEIVEFSGITLQDTDPSKVCAKASEAGLSGLLLLGSTKTETSILASHISDLAQVNWLLDLGKRELIKMIETD